MCNTHLYFPFPSFLLEVCVFHCRRVGDDLNQEGDTCKFSCLEQDFIRYHCTIQSMLKKRRGGVQQYTQWKYILTGKVNLVWTTVCLFESSLFDISFSQPAARTHQHLSSYHDIFHNLACSQFCHGICALLVVRTYVHSWGKSHEVSEVRNNRGLLNLHWPDSDGPKKGKGKGEREGRQGKYLHLHPSTASRLWLVPGLVSDNWLISTRLDKISCQ